MPEQTIENTVPSAPIEQPTPMDSFPLLSTTPSQLTEIVVDLDPQLTTYELGTKGNPKHITIQLGSVGLAIRDGDPYDHDGFPEVYLPGETISKNPYAEDRQTIVALLAFRLKEIYVKVSQWLPGISTDEDDRAIVEFSFLPQLVDPIKLLNTEKNWDKEDGNERLAQTLTTLVKRDVMGVVEQSLNVLPIFIWQLPDIEKLAGIMFSRLNNKLKAWGLRLCQETFPRRKYPQNLLEIAYQLKIAENEILAGEQSTLPQRFELDATRFGRIKSISKKYGAGIGLLVILTESRMNPLRALIEWFADQGLLELGRFAREISSPKYRNQQAAVELSARILLTALRPQNSAFGLGEWDDMEQTAPELEQVGTGRAYLQNS